MTKSQAIALLNHSFSGPCATPDYGALDREAFLIEQRHKLLSLVIEPVAVVARTSEWAQKHGSLKERSYKMVAIAGANQSWLLFNNATHEFALAYGSLETGAELELVGFSSSDALAEWCG